MKKIIVLFWTRQVGSKEANCWLRILANLSWGCLAWKAAEVIPFWLCSVDLPVTRTKLFFNLIRCFKKAEYKLQISFSSRRKVLPFTEVSWNDQRQRCLYIEFQVIARLKHNTTWPKQDCRFLQPRALLFVNYSGARYRFDTYKW